MSNNTEVKVNSKKGWVSKGIGFGIILLIAAVGLILYAIVPSLAIFTIPVWKYLVGALVLWWLINNLIFGNDLADHFSIFFQLALLFVIFKEEIIAWTGIQTEIKSWIVIVGGLLINTAVHIIFSNVGTKKVKASDKNRMGSTVVNLDAAKSENSVSNSMGELEVFYNNADAENLPDVMNLYVDNKFGETLVHVPSNWHIEHNFKNKFGDVSVRTNGENTTKTLNITGNNKFGDIKID